MIFCNFWRKFHVSAMSESKITANFWKLGGVVLLDGGNTGVSAYNPTKNRFNGVFSPFAKFSDHK